MPKIKSRQTKLSDIPDLVLVERDRYAALYQENPKSDQEIADLFRKRFEIAKEWMWTVCLDNKPVGFLSAMPTSKSPDAFTSWEDTTNNGLLIGSFDNRGKNTYVVNLDVLRSATSNNGQYMLMAQLASKVISTDKDLVYFESRMPMFREWVYEVSGIGKSTWDSYTAEQKQSTAEEYVALKSEKNGKQVIYDRLLRFYANSGFVLDRVVTEAFNDGESLNFGVVCMAKNPLPRYLRIWPLRKIIAFILSKLGKHPDMLEKFIA